MIIYLLALFVLLFGNNCGSDFEPCHREIEFVNCSEQALYILFESNYPDTMSFCSGASPALDPQEYRVESKASNTSAMRLRDCWELYFKDMINSDTLMVYVFDANDLESSDWRDSCYYELVLHRYDLSLSDIENLNWTINYP